VTDEPIIIGEYWSKEKCERVVKEALVKVQGEVKKCLTHEPPQSVFDSISSLAWNVGSRSACNSQSVKYINDYDYVTGCNLLSKRFDGSPNWSYVGTTYVQGLQNRRLAETNLCLSGIEPEIEPEVPPPPMIPDTTPEEVSKCNEDSPDA
jgi:GH24 family phage-related lysozyme (muramidase)